MDKNPVASVPLDSGVPLPVVRTGDASRISNRFGEELTSMGWVPIPQSLLRNWRKLPGDLDPTDILLLSLLIAYQRSDGSYKPARIRMLAVQMGMGDRAVRKRVKKLRELGYFNQEREPGKTAIYKLEPLYERLIVAQKNYQEERGRSDDKADS